MTQNAAPDMRITQFEETALKFSPNVMLGLSSSRVCARASNKSTSGKRLLPKGTYNEKYKHTSEAESCGIFLKGVCLSKEMRLYYAIQ